MSWQAEYARRHRRLRLAPPDRPDNDVCPHPGFQYEIDAPEVDVKVTAPFAVPASVALSKLSELLWDTVVLPITGGRRAA